MKVTEQLAKHLREVHFGGNWTASNLRDQLAGVTWRLATRRTDSFHTIAEIVYHVNYFVSVTLQVVQGGPLDAHEKESFECPSIESEQDWERLLEKTWADAEDLAGAIEQMPEDRLWEPFVDQKWGNYYRCLQGPIEHCHYHLGQIAMLKSILSAEQRPERAQ